ncbi:MAG: hypothetical protein JWN23_179 [Rhodocyclales bacterium]|nr:hypothetical protein [Rhodocyclales bacterium]
MQRWLREWQPPTDKLIIVGPSAGYTLNADFLHRWQEIVVLEPDPLARRLLRWRYPEVRWRFESLDVLSNINDLAWLSKRFANHAILFSNVLGQIAPRDETTSQAWQRSVREMLTGHYWASYHDVISTSRLPVALVAQVSSEEALDKLVARFWHGGELEIVDHGTFGLGRCESQIHFGEWFSREPLDFDQSALADAPSEKDCWISEEDGS